MKADSNQAQDAIQIARDALRSGDQATARRWAEQAARFAPDSEDPWLILAAVSEPRAALEYAKRALVINPQSQRARKAVDWARSRPGAEETPPVSSNPLERLPRKSVSQPDVSTDAQPPSPQDESPNPQPLTRNSPRRSLAYPILLVGFLCIAVAVAGWTASRSPAVASILSAGNEPSPTPTLAAYYAQADIAKPTYTPEWTATATDIPTDTATPIPSATPTPEFTTTPLPTDTPLATETPGQMEAAIVADTSTSIVPTKKAAPTQVAAPPSGGVGSGIRWIDVNLSQQMVYAYEGDTLVNSFLTSTGTWQYPTVTGSYKIYVKYLSTRMTGPGYDLPNVPYTMYFYKSYGVHGTYWHHNFGTPMSHGCVNLSIPDAEWLYYWASVGTVVNIHY
jgi:lipoprotein-anchoring transpeptidase ErfK/SrfK